MRLLDVIKNNKNNFLNKSMLINYNIYMNSVKNQNCKFVIDNQVECEQINLILDKIKELDKHAKVYVNTYYISYENDVKIYSDTIWICTYLDLDSVCELFYKNNIEPSDIELIQDNLSDEKLSYVIYENYQIEEIRDFYDKCQNQNICSIYWD